MMTNTAAMELNLDELTFIAGGDSLRDHPMYEMFKTFYKEKGITSTRNLCVYYGLSGADSWEMVMLIQEEVG